MSLENGKCPSCGGALLIDGTKEKCVCRFCGHEVIIPQAVQKCVVDGIADFDTLLLSAQEAIDENQDYDMARKNFKKALELRPHDFRVLWGIYICEIEAIKWARAYHGFVQMPNDIELSVESANQKYGQKAQNLAPEDVKPYYYRVMQENSNNIKNPIEEEEKSDGHCYVATCVYGSYDCSQVWRLRRYRDGYLMNHWYGKLFVNLYYLISPTLVKMFGNKNWFRKPIKNYLDNKISILIDKGYSDNPYKDEK